MPTSRRVTWNGWSEKARYLDAGASLDALSPTLQRIACGLARKAPTPLDALARIHVAVRDGVRYEHDAGGEDFADSLAVLAKDADDCDGKSRLFVALVRAAAIGCPGCQSLEARILPVLKRSPVGDAFVHVQGLARCAGSQAHPKAERDGWLLCELTLAGVPLGSGVEAAHRDALTGRLDVR